MNERTEMRPVNVGGTTIPDPNKVPDYQSPYPEGDLMSRTLETMNNGNGRRIHPCAPKDYEGPVAPDGWPIGKVPSKMPF